MKEKTIYALGFFDGVHLGHQALLKSCVELAKEHSCHAGAVTFATHPESLTKGQMPNLINSLADRKRLLKAYGAEKIQVLPFDDALRMTHWSAFLEQLVAKDAAGFVCGSDFRFGAKGEGNAQKLEGFCKERNLPYAIVPQQLLDGVRVSSTHIRQLLAEGKIEQANRFLGHSHIISGKVVAGKQLGTTLGIPTANVVLEDGVVCPKYGVYAGKAMAAGKSYLAVTNIGTRPTVSGEGVTVEAHLLDFTGDLYARTITIGLAAFLRPEQKFASLEELKAEIEKNAQQTRKLLGKR